MKRLLVIFLLLVISTISIAIPTLTVAQECGNALPPRMEIGETWRITPGPDNNLRAQPDLQSAKIGQIPSGREFEVIGGPVCADGYWFYEVRYRGRTGWTAESGNGEYWTEFVSAPEPTATPRPTQDTSEDGGSSAEGTESSGNGRTILVDDNCTLHQAIKSANQNSSFGGCESGRNGTDTIRLTDDIVLDNPYDNARIGEIGVEPIASDIILDGDGHRISAGANQGEFTMIAVISGDVVIRNVIFADGKGSVGAVLKLVGANLQIDNAAFVNNEASDRGGAIAVVEANLTITNSSFINNRAANNAGAIMFDIIAMDTHLRITDSVFTDNHAGGNGGALWVTQGTRTTITHSLFQNNHADGSGGGFFTEGGAFAGSRLNLQNSAFVGNSAGADGGGIFSWEGIVVVRDTTFAQNTARRYGGALHTTREAWLINTTIANNEANSGGGFFHQTTTRIAASELHLDNNIIIENNGGDCVYDDDTRTSTSVNLDSDGSCVDADRAEGINMTLADNGGGLPTFALLEDSNAINAGYGEMCEDTDQRGARRVGRCDIGAFEFDGEPDEVAIGSTLVVVEVATNEPSSEEDIEQLDEQFDALLGDLENPGDSGEEDAEVEADEADLKGIFDSLSGSEDD